ncbi:amino acid ABC transporter substrate-binding protein [Clostridiaceae bacterium Marseille-Q3526]|nr:amino acid ABC transporter substrate-binding protein [Clostridiaceae bacterium Marseille-Q3526]
MKKRVWAMGAAVMMMGALTACAGGSDSKAASTQAEESGTEAGKGAVSESEGDDTETRQAERTDETSEGGTFTVGFDQDFPPMGFVGEDGEYTGFDLELAQETAKRLGLTYVAQPIAWDAKNMELESGNIDCIWNGFTMTGREDEYTWSEPYMENSQVVVVMENSGIETLEDLAGKIVEVQADSSAEAALKEMPDLTSTFGTLQTTPDYNTAFMDLEMGSVDAIAMDVIVAGYQMQEREGSFKILEESLASEEYAIGFKKGNTELCEKVQQTLEEMAADGTMAEISEKWFGEDITTVGK